MQFNPEYDTKTSGEKRVWETGSQRDSRRGKGRFDLISPRFLRRLASVLERGAEHYGDRNWEKGQPLGSYLDSALRHINSVLLGDKSEDHAAQAAWNLHSLIHTAELIAEGRLLASLDDIGYVVPKVFLTDRLEQFLHDRPHKIEDTFDYFMKEGLPANEILDAVVALRDGKGILTYIRGDEGDIYYALKEGK